MVQIGMEAKSRPVLGHQELPAPGSGEITTGAPAVARRSARPPPLAAPQVAAPAAAETRVTGERAVGTGAVPLQIRGRPRPDTGRPFGAGRPPPKPENILVAPLTGAVASESRVGPAWAAPRPAAWHGQVRAFGAEPGGSRAWQPRPAPVGVAAAGTGSPKGKAAPTAAMVAGTEAAPDGPGAPVADGARASMGEVAVGAMVAGPHQEAIGSLVPDIPLFVATAAPAKAVTQPPRAPPTPPAAVRGVAGDLETSGATAAPKAASAPRERARGSAHRAIPRVPALYIGRAVRAAAPGAGRRRAKPAHAPAQTEGRGRARVVPGNGPWVAPP